MLSFRTIFRDLMQGKKEKGSKLSKYKISAIN